MMDPSFLFLPIIKDTGIFNKINHWFLMKKKNDYHTCGIYI